MRGLSPRAQKLVYAFAQDEGRKSGCEQLFPEHVMLALLKNADGLGYFLIKSLRTDVLALQLNLEKVFIAREPLGYSGEIPPSRRLKAMFDLAGIEARILKNDYIGTEHFVLASIREDNSITARYFESIGVNIEDARRVVLEIQAHTPSSVIEQSQRNASKAVFQNFVNNQNQQGSAQNKKNQKSFLQEFSRDLTFFAREGKAEPFVGRESELKRLIQILSRRTKNNPVLVGAPGIGKTAIVEGLAYKIAKGDVPRHLLKKRLLSLDIAAMVAGTKYRGEFEERMKRMMKEIKDDASVILFIDELHTIIGAGGPEGTLDASNMLKPALSRGEIQIIGVTTTKEYSKYIEKDSALERRFQKIKIEEPSEEDTVKILSGLKSKYEDYHSVSFDESVLPAIVKFSKRYIPERFLPDKAIDILDEVGAAKRIQEDSKPSELAELEMSIANLIEEKRHLVEEQNYEKAAFVRDKVTELRKKFELYSEYWRNNAEAHRCAVSEKDICSVIGKITGIPIEHLDTSETERLVRMEDELNKMVIGQEDAIHIIAGAVRRSRAGVSSFKRPLGSFIFLGPTGVGKTELAKSLAKFLFAKDDSLIRIDMSDYMEKHNASRLIGAPPGYIGYEEGGVLTEAVRNHPYSVVLLDEIEKAHPDVFNLLLQLLEEGELQDNLGHTVNFRNTIVIMTSNAGARQITSGGKAGFLTSSSGIMSYDEIKASSLSELKKLMSPELLNRIDDVVVFNALTKEQVARILDLQLSELSTRLLEQNITLTVKPRAKDYLVEHGYDPELGARPMRRLLQKEIEAPLSVEILLAKKDASNEVVVDLQKDGKLRVKFAKKKNTELPLVASHAPSYTASRSDEA